MTKKWKNNFLYSRKWCKILWFTKFYVLLTMLGVMYSYGDAQAQTFTLKVENLALKDVFKKIETESEYRFLFKSEDVARVTGITFSVANAGIDEILALCLKNTRLIYEKDGSLIVIKQGKDDTKEKKQEKRVIQGKVLDEKSETLPGATVLLRGTTLGVVTDADGKFRMEVPQMDTTVLLISFIGYQTHEVVLKKDPKNDAKELVIRMKLEVAEVDEVVVTGYAQIRKESFTGNSISVSREELLNVSKTNVIQALQVFDPSFRIQENNQWGSDPNAVPEMYIRGRSGIGVKQLDANSLSKSNLEENPNLPLFIMDGFEITVQKLYDMDPNRIENITILKDAAATAMYGSRSANGVVVITTVAPKPGEVSVSYGLTGTLSMPDLTDYNLMNAAEKLETERVAGLYTYDSDEEVAYNQLTLDEEYYKKLANIKRGVDTYWLSKPLRTVFNHQHSLYIEGGSTDMRFGLDVLYNNDNGVMKESARNRYGVGLSIDYRLGDFQIKNYISYNVTKSKESPYGSFSDYTKKMPYDEYKDENGKYLKETQEWIVGGDEENPLYEATLKNYDEDQIDELINNLAINWYINDYWQIKGQFSVTKTTTRGERFLDPESQKNGDLLGKDNPISGELRTEENNGFKWDLTATAAYNRSIGKNYINLTFGINAKDEQSKSLSSFYKGFPNGSLSSINYANEIVEKPTVNQNKSRLFGMLASVNYTYDNIYLLDISLRMDGSSEFGVDKRFAPFFSGGVGINIHNYEFMKNLGYVNMLKIRGSYGATGKVNFPAYAARTMYKIQNDKWYRTGIGASLVALGNSGLTWETTNTLDVGFDIQMLDGLIYVNASYYRKKTVDLINDVTIASSTGFTTYVDNIGEIMNKGIDVQVRSDVYKSKDWMVAVFGNLSHNENKLLKISESLKAYNDQVQAQYADYGTGYLGASAGDTKYSKTFTQYVEGGSTTSIWGMKSLGINPSDGEEVLVRRDGSTTYEWEAAEQVILGDTEPKVQGAFGFNVRYKNWSLYTTFLYKLGGQEYNSTLVNKVENARISSENVDKRVFSQRWKQPGDHAKYKKLQTKGVIQTTRPTERFVQDNNVLTLNSLTLGYDFGQKILKKIGFGVLRLELGANELFRVSSVKFERGIDYPYARKMNISLKASF
ncbi:SusC/RagA family TonB-linked outer membrane protein [Butyricimonas hominis]|uniref:SusC/RagA family TonB-linked outer membrane protein n=1 Tax=Butyricimonas TaxID=574697 RepID=UPI003512C90E